MNIRIAAVKTSADRVMAANGELQEQLDLVLEQHE
jgi:hypothetical protein